MWSSRVLSRLSCRLSVWSLLASIALAGCASSSDPPPPDAAPSLIPTSAEGAFAIASALDVPVPAAAQAILATLSAATDGADDPSRFLLERMIATLPEGTIRSLASQAVPYVAAYLNERVSEIAPQLVPGLEAMVGGLARIAGAFDTVETLQITKDGSALRTITGVRFELARGATVVSFGEAGLPDLVSSARVELDAAGALAISPHSHPLPVGALLRLGLDRAISPSVAPGARDVAGALAALVDCDRLGALVSERIGLGAPTLYRAACRTAMIAVASEIEERIAEVDRAAIVIDVAGSALGVDRNGDGALDELRAGRWTGSVISTSGRIPIGAASFAGSEAP